MTNPSMILDFAEEDVRQLMEDTETLKTWEYIRSTGRAITLEEITSATDIDRTELHRQIDRLLDIGLLKSIRARKPRTEVGYKATCGRVVVSYDEHNSKITDSLMALSKKNVEDFNHDVATFNDPNFHSKAGFRFRQYGTHHFTKEEFTELRRRVLSVVSFLTMPRTPTRRGSPSESKETETPRYCNQAVSITLDPLAGPLLPLPTIITTPWSKLSQWDDSQAMAGGLATLSPREREIALALTDGLSRKQIAEQLGLSVHTVATLARRAYKKIGVSSQAELAARLSGHDRPTPGGS